MIGSALAWAGDRDSGAAAVLGDWYVLVHYAGSTQGTSGGFAWDDEVWRIETEGSGLRWTIFPHPEFREASGRWESLEGGADVVCFSGDKLLGGPQCGIFSPPLRVCSRGGLFESGGLFDHLRYCIYFLNEFPKFRFSFLNRPHAWNFK